MKLYVNKMYIKSICTTWNVLLKMCLCWLSYLGYWACKLDRCPLHTKLFFCVNVRDRCQWLTKVIFLDFLFIGLSYVQNLFIVIMNLQKLIKDKDTKLICTSNIIIQIFYFMKECEKS